MRVLIDECLDWRLAKGLPGHVVNSVQRMGWAGVKNGHLLTLAEDQFDVFITGDRNVSFQQDIPQFGIAVVVLTAASTQLKDNLPLMPPLLAKLSQLQPGTVPVLTRNWCGSSQCSKKERISSSDSALSTLPP